MMIFPTQRSDRDLVLAMARDCFSKLLVPYVDVNPGALSFPAPGNHPSSLVIAISLDPRDKWENNIFENSNYMKLQLDSDGTLCKLVGRFPFRKRNVGSIPQAVEAIAKAMTKWQPSQARETL